MEDTIPKQIILKVDLMPVCNKVVVVELINHLDNNQVDKINFKNKEF